MPDSGNIRFKEFVERIIGKSRLELAGGKLATAFQEETVRNNLLLSEFLDTFMPRWEWWKTKKGAHQISPFIEEVGAHIFKIWLSFTFPFNYRRLEIECAKGESMVDAQGSVYYTYSPDEREIIKAICDQFNIDTPERDVARLLITNAIKSLDPTISKIIGNSYRIFTDKIDFFDGDNDAFFIRIGFVGRIG
jgi:hypothetical protein